MGTLRRAPCAVIQIQVIPRDAQHRARLQPLKLPDAVFGVNQIIAHMQAERVGDRTPRQPRPRSALPP